MGVSGVREWSRVYNLGARIFRGFCLTKWVARPALRNRCLRHVYGHFWPVLAAVWSQGPGWG